MPVFLRRRSIISLLVALGLLLGVIVATAFLVGMQRNDQAAVSRSLDAQVRLSRVFSLLQDAETFGEKDFRHANPRFHGLNWRRNRDQLNAYLKLAKSWGVKPATLAIAWTLAKAPNVVPIPGTRTAAHLEECAEAAETDLTAAQVADIERALPVGFAAGERYSDQQWVGIQKY